jgi:hypothetical protein
MPDTLDGHRVGPYQRCTSWDQPEYPIKRRPLVRWETAVDSAPRCEVALTPDLRPATRASSCGAAGIVWLANVAAA